MAALTQTDHWCSCFWCGVFVCTGVAVANAGTGLSGAIGVYGAHMELLLLAVLPSFHGLLLVSQGAHQVQAGTQGCC